MNGVLVAGCGLAGVVSGGALGVLAGRIDRPAEASVGTSPVLAGRPDLPGPSTGAVVAAELVTGGSFALAALRLGAVPALAAFCVLFAGLVPAAAVDLRLGIVPRRVVYATALGLGAALLGAAAASGTWWPLGRAAIGGAAALGVFFALWWFAPRSIGFGDVRLAGLIGFGLCWLGFGQLYVGFAAAFLAGALLGVGLMVARGTGRKTRLPFAPPLAVGAAVGVLWGGWLVHVWLHRG
jgi:leader peptidase (prepilin peptidase)/N-methyltransferase